jgi:hypothetical protein
LYLQAVGDQSKKNIQTIRAWAHLEARHFLEVMGDI